MGKLNNLQALRALAALCVVFLHTHYSLPWFPEFGHCGVDVFFVISGFVMASVCTRENAAEFVKRRLTRILPMYFIFTLLFYVIAHTCKSVMRTTPDMGAAMLVKSLLFIPFERPNGLGVYPVLYVGWTLNIEMFFYAALAVGLVVCRRRAALVGSALIAVFFCLFSLLHIFVFYATPKLFEFIAGVVCFEIYKRLPGINPVPLFASLFAGVVLLFTPAVYPGISAVIIVLSGVLLSSGGIDLKSKPVIMAGDSSYALYLSHPFVIGILSHIGILGTNSLPASIVSIGCTCLVAAQLHSRLERPLVSWLNRKLSKPACGPAISEYEQKLPGYSEAA